MRKLFTFFLALFALTAMADKVVLHEDFSTLTGSIPGSGFDKITNKHCSYNSEKLTLKGTIYQYKGCIRLGGSNKSKTGYLTLKNLADFGTTPVEGTLTFKAAPWKNLSGTTVKVTISGAGQISKNGTNFSSAVTSEALTAEKWNEVTFHIKGATSATRLELTNGAEDPRIFLDDLHITAKTTGTEQTLSFATPAFTYVLGSAEYTAANNKTAQTVTGAKTNVTYTSDKPTVAKVENGKLVLGTAGTATITATAAAGEADGVSYFEASASYTVTIVPQISIPFTYDGNGSELPAALIGNNLESYSQHPQIKFAKDGSSLTFHLPSHSGLAFWYDYKENDVVDGTFHVQTSIDGTNFTDVTPVVARTHEGTPTRYAVDIAANVCAVKLLYNKKLGNVAIGALHVEKAVSFNVTDAQYATFISDKNVYLPQGIKAGIVEAMGNGIKVKYLEGQIVNANVPVLLQANTATAYSAEPIVETEEAATFAGNILKGCLQEEDVTAESGQKIYVLNIGSKGVGFYWQKDTDGSNAKIGAGHAYLSRPFASGGVQGFSLVDPIVTGVEAVETQNTEEDAPIYDLSGRRVTHPTHGIYIIGGKKVMR